MFYNPDITNCYTIQFDSLWDMTEYVNKCCPADEKDRFIDRGGDYSTTIKWLGHKFDKWPDVQTLAAGRWDKGMELYESMAHELRNAAIVPPKSLKRRQVWNEDDGDELDIDRLEAGQPFLRSTRRQHRPGPMAATIVTNVSTNAGADPVEIMWRGLSAIVLTELLEEAGYRVELWAGDLSVRCGLWNGVDCFGKPWRPNHFTSVNLKRGSDPLDVGALINATSGWYFRTMFFGAEYIGPDGNPKTLASLGSAGPIGQMLRLITPDEQAIVCEDIWTKQQAIDWIKLQIANLK